METKDSKELEYLVEEIARACESPGFFHVAGHGVPEQLVKDAQSHAAKLFDLPLDKKLQGSFAAGATKHRRGYKSTPKTFTPPPALIWEEGFTLIGDKSGQVDVVCGKDLAP
ncbi:hypothetical protein R1flu_007706 [Riccia fluitans]|uniref:Non-haem dioxygenase N-terminal domain-containing protein n=1 Tax=Riccia fluitans TaxID=41844 RepID=A0ABD1YZL9_9MARC